VLEIPQYCYHILNVEEELNQSMTQAGFKEMKFGYRRIDWNSKKRLLAVYV
jgi:hypothetical protein